MSIRQFSIVFLIIAVAQLASELFLENLPFVQYVIKPLIMISLSWFFWKEMREQYQGIIYLMQVALVFSWLGDVFLMFKGDTFFILGLGSFLLSQVGYAIVFSRQSGGFLRQKPYWVLPFVGYIVLLLFLVWPGLGPLKVPVSIYAVAIMSMAMMALNRRGAVSAQSFTWVLAGALLFVLSDSLIALNKFSGEIPLARTWIMATYMAAQYLIVIGYLKSRGRAIG